MFTKKIYFLILAGMFMSCSHSTNQLQMEQYTLSNGLKVVLAPTQSHFVTVSLQYGVGGAFENDDQLGLSHLLEHLMFKTSKHLKTGEFNSILEKELGGVFNAMTTYDSTIYHETVPAQNVSRVLALEAERMVNLTLVPEEVRKEKDVVLEEMRNRIENSDFGFMFDQVSSIFFQNYPYGRDLGGKKNILDISDETIQNYYKSHYAPNNATLIITGKIEQNIKKDIEKNFGSLAPSNLQPKTTPVDFTPKIGVFDIKRAVKLNYVMLLTKMPAANDNLTPGFNILSYLLTNGNTSILVQKLVQQEALVSSISAMADTSALPSAFIIVFTPYHAEDIPKIQKRIQEILIELMKSNTLSEEIQKAHLSMATDYYNSLQDTSDLAVSIAQGVSLNQDPEFLINLQTKDVNIEVVKDVLDHLIKSDWSMFKMLKENQEK